MLKVDNINVYYGAIHAIKNVSFQVNEGEIVTLRLNRCQRRRQVHHTEDHIRPSAHKDRQRFISGS